MTELVIPRRYDGLQHRAADVEDIDLEQGVLVCRAAPYDHEVMLDPELYESFAPKCFERAANAPSRVKLWHLHNGPLVGHALDVEDRPDGVWLRCKFSNTVNAIEARELASDGSLDQVSVTFRAMRDYMRIQRRSDGIHVRHSRAGLLGIALVPHGAYDDMAAVVSVRDADSDRAREAALAKLQALTH